MKKAVRVLSIFGISVAALAAAGALSFWLLIIAGLSPKLQTIWICSAMRTMSHQYLATAFFSQEKIDKVLADNSVDDRGYDSELLTLEKPSSSSIPEKTGGTGDADAMKDAAEEAMRRALENMSSDSGQEESVPPDDGDLLPDAAEPEPAEPEPEETEAPEPPETEPAEEVSPEPEPEKTGPWESRPLPEAAILVLGALASAEREEEPPAEELPPEDPTKGLPDAVDKISASPAKDVAGAKAAEAARAAKNADSLLAEGYEKLEEGIYLKSVSGLTWRGYMMLVTEPTRVRVTDTSQQWVCGENVMTMVKNVGAIAGINGGGFKDGPNYDSNGGTPGGLIIEQGQLVCPTVPDDVTVYNMIGINADGVLVLRHCTAEWALSNRIVSAVSFAPFLVVNGEGLVKNGSGGWGIAPRTAIGQRASGEMLLLVIDGRQADWSIGCDLDVLQDVMLAEGAVNAAMLDGGSSTAMVYQGEYVNRPSLGHERWINNCFTVMPIQ